MALTTVVGEGGEIGEGGEVGEVLEVGEAGEIVIIGEEPLQREGWRQIILSEIDYYMSCTC